MDGTIFASPFIYIIIKHRLATEMNDVDMLFESAVLEHARLKAFELASQEIQTIPFANALVGRKEKGFNYTFQLQSYSIPPIRHSHGYTDTSYPYILFVFHYDNNFYGCFCVV